MSSPTKYSSRYSNHDSFPSNHTSLSYSSASASPVKNMSYSSRTNNNNLPAWVATQQKAFMRWVNTYLETKNLEPLKDLAPDLSNGVKLIQLLEIIGGESLGRYYPNPRLRVQKAENVNTALDFIKHRGVMVYNIGAEDIIDCNLKLVLGLLWVLILRFTISDINEEGLSAKEGLLLWCQRKTAGYEGVDVKDFSTSWTDGLAFCALLDRHRPDLMDFYELDPADHRGNMTEAFRVANEVIGIPQLLDVEDICDVNKPDERSIMTYVAYWFHAFSALDKIETAGRRLEKFVEVTASALEMQHSYEERIKKLLKAIEEQKLEWENCIFTDSYTDAKHQKNLFTTYKRTTKREWITEKSELTSLLGNIRTKLATYGLAEYNPPEGLRLSDLEATWRSLLKSEASHAKTINTKLGEIKDKLRKRFADTANEFALSLDTVSLRISDLDGELEKQLVGITDLGDKIKPLDGLLAELKDLDRQCQEANVEENDYTVYSYDELEYELGLAKQSVVKKLAFIENQIVARSMTNLTPIQLEEFESVFRYFDKNHRNALSESEFSGALASLGLVYSEEEMHDVFQIAAGLDSSQVNQGHKPASSLDPAESINSTTFSRSSSASSYTTVNSNYKTHSRNGSASSILSSTRPSTTNTYLTPNLSSPRYHAKSASRDSLHSNSSSSYNDDTQPTVSFEQFIKFMVEVTEDQQTAEQVFKSFVEVANGKSYVTELDLQNSLVPDQMVEILVNSMPEVEDSSIVEEEEIDGKKIRLKGLDYVKYMRNLTGITMSIESLPSTPVDSPSSSRTHF